MDRIVKLKISVFTKKAWARFSITRKILRKKKQKSTKSN